MTGFDPRAFGPLITAQAESGAFPAVVHLSDGDHSDENGFITALVLHELAPYTGDEDVRAAIERGLDFLERCEDEGRPGYFRFYPRDAHPAWIGTALHADADDTALLSVLLERFGRRPRSFLRAVVERVLGPHRLLHHAAWAMRWQVPGTYFTWLDDRIWPRVIDCCVNVNVATLLKRSGLPDPPGLTEIVSMIEAGISWAGGSRERARMLVPFYPEPAELVWAVERAVELGVEELRPACTRLAEVPWRYPVEGARVCGSMNGAVQWSAPVLHGARSVAREEDRSVRGG